MNNEIMPWQKQIGEPDEIFDIFQKYLELGSIRSHKLIAAISSMSSRTIDRYASHWKWSGRIEAYEKYIKANYKLGLLEYCKEFEEKKFHLKLNLSKVSQELCHNMKVWMEHSECIYDNAEVIKRLQFFGKCASVAKKFYSLIDFKLSPSVLTTKFKRDIMLDPVESTKEDFDPKFIPDKYRKFDKFLDEFSDYIKEKNTIGDDFAAIDRLNQHKFLENNDLQNVQMSEDDGENVGGSGNRYGIFGLDDGLDSLDDDD